MQRDGRVLARVAHAVDVGGGEVKALGGPKNTIARRSVDREALLAHAPADHGDGSGGDVVVVKAGVVVVHPADQPRRQVRVGEQLLVDALGVIVVDAVDPQLRPIGELGDERLQLGARSGPGRAGGVRRRGGVSSESLLPRDRDVWGLSRASAASDLDTATGREPVRRGTAERRRAEGARGGVGEQLPVERLRLVSSSAGSTTGRSDPYRSCPGPPIASDRAPIASRSVGGGVVEDERVVLPAGL